MNKAPTPEQIFGTFVNWKYDDHTWFITGLSGTLYMYLIEGEEKALLIDTAYGFCDMKAYCMKLTDKPIIVVNTHGHLDHAGGNGYFTEVYMHEKAPMDFETFKGGPCDITKLPYRDYEKKFIKEGDTIELGGRKIEIINITSHSNGSLAFLDTSHGLLYCGDELESEQVLMYEMVEDINKPYDLKEHVETHKANMEKLWKYSDKFQFCCPAHNGSPIAKEYIQDYIGLSNAILNRTVTVENKLHHEHIDRSPLGPLLCRVRFNKASFFVRKDQLSKI